MLVNTATSLSYFALGCLQELATSGCDSGRVLKSLGWPLGNPSIGAIYPVLHVMSKEGSEEDQVDNRATSAMTRASTAPKHTHQRELQSSS